MINNISLKICLKIFVGLMALSAVMVVDWIHNSQGGLISSWKDFLEGTVIGIVSAALVIWLIALVRNVHLYRKTGVPYNSLLLSIGMLSMVLGIMLNRLPIKNIAISVVTAILILNSIVFNLIYLIQFRRTK